jgi:hypothetical protein
LQAAGSGASLVCCSQLEDDEAAFTGATSLVWLPNVLCCERNYDNCHDDQCSHLHPKIVGESGFVAGLCVHLVTSLSLLFLDPCGARAS